MLEQQRVQCMSHSDRNKFKYGKIISIGKDTILVKYDDDKYNKGETIEYPKSYYGRDLEIVPEI